MGIAASVIAHLSVLMLVLLFGEVHPYGSATADPIAVDIVTPEEVAEQKAEPAVAPETKPAIDLPAQQAPPSPPAPAPAPASQAAAPPPPPPAAPSPPPAAAPSPPPPPAGRMAAAPPPSTSPAYVAPEPDLSVKYQVILGLPPDLSQDPPAKSGDRAGEPFDSASTPADIASNLVAEFRRHLGACLKRPQSIAPSDKLKIKLRVFMTPEARLAAEPILLEASASPKGPALMQGAISALQACQPYAMLPADRYGEWKVLDLSFTPQDFAS